MHEASLMANLMRKLNEAARTQRARRIVGVSVWLGALSHMSAEHFSEHFAQAASGTVADGAELDIAVSDDIGNPNAGDVLVKTVRVEE